MLSKLVSTRLSLLQTTTKTFSTVTRPLTTITTTASTTTPATAAASSASSIFSHNQRNGTTSSPSTRHYSASSSNLIPATTATNRTTRRTMSSHTPTTTTTSPLKEEALWALQEAKKQNMIGPEDTALIFHSWTQHRHYLQHLQQAFASVADGKSTNTLHAIAVKTNPHPAILRQLVELGFGLECASMEEVYLSMNAGCPGDHIVFDSPVKTRHELHICHTNPALRGILVNVNCLEELERIPADPNFVVGLRINPLVHAGGPEMFQVSGDESKFGIPITHKDLILDAIEKYPITQLHVHSGTAMEDLSVAVDAIASVVDVAVEANTLLEQAGQTERRIVGVDIGGGLRPEILETSSSTDPNNQKQQLSRMEYYVVELKKAAPALWDNNMKLVTEFGQWSYFYSGFVWSKIEYALQREHTRVAYLHVGADMFLRDIYTGKDRGMEYLPVNSDGSEMDTRPHTLTDLAGPLCFAGDYLQQQIQFPTLEEGDEVLLLNTGSNAYGLWSRHCSRTIPQVIGVDRNTDTVLQMSPRKNPYLAEHYQGTLLPWDVTTTGTTTTEDDNNEEEEEEATTASAL